MAQTTSSEPVTTPSGVIELAESVPADLTNLASARANVSRWLNGVNDQLVDDQLVDDQLVDDVVLVVNELLSNAICGSAPQNSVEYRLTWHGDQISSTVINHRTQVGLLNTSPMPAPEAESGRGLPIAEMYSDQLEILLALDRVEITATFFTPSPRVWAV